MFTLSLLRHAKSSWQEKGQTDFDRPLAPRGRKAAPRMGQWLRAHELVPDKVLCSTALRTRQTAELVFERDKQKPEIVFEAALYLAEPATLLEHIRKTARATGHLMLIGHNPGLQDLALELIGQVPSADAQALREKFPTAGLAVFSIEGSDWRKVRPGEARLEHFVRPKLLDD